MDILFCQNRSLVDILLKIIIHRWNPSGKYFVSLATETDVVELQKTNSGVGIDFGLKDFAILSDGTVYSNPKFFRTLEEKLAKGQLVMSRRTICGAN